MAHIENSTWNNVVYFPQAPVSIYLLECGEGIGANLAKGSDLVTNNLGNDWTGEHYILYECLCHTVSPLQCPLIAGRNLASVRMQNPQVY